MAAAPELVVVEDADVPLVEDGAVEQVLCEECGDGPAILFCRQCSQHGSLVCEECVKQHRKRKNYGGHKIISLAEIASATSANVWHARRFARDQVLPHVL